MSLVEVEDGDGRRQASHHQGKAAGEPEGGYAVGGICAAVAGVDERDYLFAGHR
jgi:hypothetical protein